MSHFTKVKTRIMDLEALCKALDKLGYAYTAAEVGSTVAVRGYQGNAIDAKISIHTGEYDIGVVVDKDGVALAVDVYSLVADWWGIEDETGCTETEIVNRILKMYGFVKVVTACTAQGYEVGEPEVRADGSVQVMATQWN